MDTKRLNTRILVEPVTKVCDLILQNRPHIDEHTLTLYIQQCAITHYPTNDIERIVLIFTEDNKMTLEHVNALFKVYKECDHYRYGGAYGRLYRILFNVPLRFNGTTLTNMYFGDRFIYALRILNIMYENKTLMNDEGFYAICEQTDKKFLTREMPKIFELGYIPNGKSIDYLLLNKNCIDTCLIYVINKFEMKLNEEQLRICEDKGIYVFLHMLTIEEIEQKCSKYKLAKFQKYIPKETKLTQQCLYNACALNANTQSIKTLVSKYDLKPDTKCLELSTTIKENKTTNVYLINKGVQVSALCLSNVIDAHKNYKKCPVYDAWKEQNTTSNIKIQGIDG